VTLITISVTASTVDCDNLALGLGLQRRYRRCSRVTFTSGL